MPAEQRGWVVERGPRNYQARWRDEQGKPRGKSGFETQTAAWKFLRSKIDEVLALRRGELIPVSHRPQTVDALLDSFLEKHGATVDPATKRKLTRQLRQARDSFGDRHPDSLNRLELEDWRNGLAAGSRHDVFRAFRQGLAWAHARGLADREPSAGVRNPKRKRHERRPIVPFETWDEVAAIDDELDELYRGLPTFAVGTGLRPEEWAALERADVDRQAGVVHVRRRHTGGELKQGTKTVPERVVPLRVRVLEALDARPPRLHTRLLFPAPRGGYIDLERFRHREWTPALRAAGILHRSIYTCRHTFATWAIDGGRIPIPQLATIMGTSIRELEDTYFRWLHRTDDALRAALDAYDARIAAT
jgi:integrase